MVRQETAARVLLTFLLVTAVAIPFVGRWLSVTPVNAVTLHARMPEAGGWSPAALHATAGQPLHLRLVADDVVHSFAVGGMDWAPVDILPGEVKPISLTFTQPGTYTFYCTRWCGPNHWRMRGVIEVDGPATAITAAAVPPLWVRLGLDLDSPHPAAVLPHGRPSAARGRILVASPEAQQYLDPGYYRAHAPAGAWQELRADPALAGRSDAQLWDLVAAIWEHNTDPAALSAGRELYARDCAACHGERGAGDGIFAEGLATAGAASAQSMAGGKESAMQAPPDFTDPATLLGASPALLQGKILRGGMGTGMPMWGAIYTPEQTWDLVAYLFTFQLDEPTR